MRRLFCAVAALAACGGSENAQPAADAGGADLASVSGLITFVDWTVSVEERNARPQPVATDVVLLPVQRDAPTYRRSLPEAPLAKTRSGADGRYHLWAEEGQYTLLVYIKGNFEPSRWSPEGWSVVTLSHERHAVVDVHADLRVR